MALLCIAATAVLLGGCQQTKDTCTDAELELNLPAGATSFVAGEAIQVDYSYRTRGWAYNRLTVLVGLDTLCLTGLTSVQLSGNCPWNTNGLPPGEYTLTLTVFERGTFEGFCVDYPSTSRKVQLPPAAPQITRQPENASVAEGAVTTFSVAARGSGPFTYQWQKSIDTGTNWSNLPAVSDAGVSSSHTTPPATAADNGALFRVQVSNSAGTVTSNAAMLTVSAGACTVSAATPLCVDDPALAVSTFSTAPMHSVALPGFAAAAFPGYVYGLARTVSPRIDELVQFDANGNEAFRGRVAVDAAVLKMGAGAYVGRLFAADRALPTDAPDGVYEVQAPGRSVTLFSTVGGGNPDPHGMAFGSGGGFGDFMYVANPTTGTTDPVARRAIVRLRADGTVDGALATHPEGPYYLAFPSPAASAAYGEYLYFTLLESHRLMRVNAAGTVETFATFADGERPIDLAFGRGGALGGTLYVAVFHPDDATRHRLARVLPDGTIQTVVRGLRGFRFDIDPDNDRALFLANEGGGIVRVHGKSP